MQPLPPNLHAFAERFVRSIKEECLRKMIFVGRASLRRAITEYMTHYHEERNHQGEPPRDSRRLHFLSNRVQALCRFGFHGVLVLAMAFRMETILRMQATTATLCVVATT